MSPEKARLLVRLSVHGEKTLGLGLTAITSSGCRACLRRWRVCRSVGVFVEKTFEDLDLLQMPVIAPQVPVEISRLLIILSVYGKIISGLGPAAITS